MATFYSASTNQRDGVMSTIYMREPEQNPYSDSSGNMLYLNYSSSAPYSDSLPISTQPQQQCIQLPHPSAVGLSQESLASAAENAYNASHFGNGRSEMLLMQTVGGPSNDSEGFVQSPSHLGILDGHKLSLEQPKGLSLSLGTQIPGYNHVHMASYSSLFGIPGYATSIPNSKYLKAAQQLLEEVVNVQDALKRRTERSQSGVAGYQDTTNGGSRGETVPSNPQGCASDSCSELSPAERQELQNKVTKLLAMLDEVDRRYKQYYHQMQIVVSSFDSIAGSGAAKPYIALALQTISRHFRCLRDAITTQIKAARKTLGEQESSSGKGAGISRLRYIDQQIRQQRAMQQFGMMQPHAWRPQRGLPENSVSILRAWLFEHFLHPYPKDSEKLMLARQTGLTRGQVANWFINARVRLWKPMIEEMYKEEIGDAELDSNSCSENHLKFRDEMKSLEDKEEPQQSTASERYQTSQFNHEHSKSSTLISDADITTVHDPYHKLRERMTQGENCGMLQEALNQADGSEGLVAYQMAEMSRYNGKNSVSLTLGLQHCDGGGIPIPDAHQSFMSMKGNIVYGTKPPSAGREDFEYVNIGDQRHRFGPSHLLHDFVA